MLEGQPDHQGAGDQRVHGLPGQEATGGGRLRGCVEPQATSGTGGCADFRRRERSKTDRAGLFQASQGARALDLAAVGEKGRGTANCRSRQRLDDWAGTKKNILQPHRQQCWVIPPKANGAFVAAMEDVLAVYTRPRDPDYPLVCLDETSKQFFAETRLPIPMKRGRPARCDYEYERNGTANIFMMFAPLEGWRHVKVTDRHTAVGLRSRLERIGRSLLRQRQDRRTGPGQSQHSRQGVTLRSVSSRRGQATGRALRMALHSKAR